MDEHVEEAVNRLASVSPRSHHILTLYLQVREGAPPVGRLGLAQEFTRALLDPDSVADPRWGDVTILSRDQRDGVLGCVLRALVAPHVLA